jgi:hypothetical protein
MHVTLKRAVALSALVAGLVGCGSASPGFVAYEPQSPPAAGTDALAALGQRPMQLPSLASSASCPASPGGISFGPGPVYVTGQSEWYSAGQAVVLMVDSKYSGPVLVRGSELVGGGLLRIKLADLSPAAMAGFAAKESSHSVAAVSAVHTPDGALELPADLGTPSPRAWVGLLSTDGSGCFGLQLDGSTFTEIVVLSVRPGNPPPG